MNNKINRRQCLDALSRGIGVSMAPCLLSGCRSTGQSNPPDRKKKQIKHLITLSFDDGFKKSSLETARLFEKYHLSACINVIATGHLKSFRIPDAYQADISKGDFGLWNELKARGHEIMPHGYRHANKAKMPFEQARDLVLRCLDIFSRELKDFDPRRAVFNFPYNASTPALEKWLAAEVLAFRTGGPALNPLPHPGQVKLTCTSHGPGNIDRHLESKVDQLLSRQSGWLIYNTHGLDGEGWGPVSSYFLEKLINRLLALDAVTLLPAAQSLLTLAPA